jgi:hypothetical protein
MDEVVVSNRRGLTRKLGTPLLIMNGLFDEMGNEEVLFVGVA